MALGQQEETVGNGCRCGCATYREHISSLHLRPTAPGVKKTVDDTDHTVNTTTEHWNDRVDVHVQQKGPIYA